MRWLRTMVCIAAVAAAPGVPARDAVAPAMQVSDPNTLTVISYHEVRDDVRDYPDPHAVDSSSLVRQFEWLRGNGYVPVNVDAVIASRAGGKALPAKAVLLTFDDAYLSFYTRVLPILREFRFPAVLAVVGKWIDSPPDGKMLYGEKASVTDASFVTWPQLREITASGLVDVGSHAYDLHRGLLANPQGNLQAAATTRTYDVASGRHEDDATWSARVREDLMRNSLTIERETGRRPRVIAWPYGAYNDELVRIAGELGMPVALTLDDGVNTPDVPLTALRRILVAHNLPLGDFASAVRGPLLPDPVRVVQLSLGAMYDADPAIQERKLSAFLDRIKALEPSHVFLEASADTDGDGITDAAYFPTRHLPLRANLFDRVAWQLVSRNKVKVYAVLPVSAFRLSRGQVEEVYEDLARHAYFDGLLLMQDGPPSGVSAADFVASTQRLADGVRRWRAPMQVARGLELPSQWTSDAEAALARSVETFAAASDYVVVKIPPGQTGSYDSRALVPPGSRISGGRYRNTASKIVFMLDKGDDRVSTARQMRIFQLNGALNFGYGGDDFMRDDPPFAQIAPAMSLRIHPR